MGLNQGRQSWGLGVVTDSKILGGGRGDRARAWNIIISYHVFESGDIWREIE